jgi:hypothetical protein
MVGLNWLPEPQVFEVGEVCHLFMPNHRGETTEGVVVAVLNLKGWLFPQYVVEVPCPPVDPFLEVRCGLLGLRKHAVRDEPDEECDADAE